MAQTTILESVKSYPHIFTKTYCDTAGVSAEINHLSNSGLIYFDGKVCRINKSQYQTNPSL